MNKICALYKFVPIAEHKLYKLRDRLLSFMEKYTIMGTLLIATEGINGTISGTETNIQKLLDYIESKTDIGTILPKYSFFNGTAFNHCKVKIKNEIVTMGVENIDPLKMVGKYIDPQDWNSLIADKNTFVIDTRNDYEFKIGTFKNAHNPNIKTFRQFVEWYEQHKEFMNNKNLALFCTGGIRCEKATSLLLLHGEKNVFHLNGGILAYLEQIPKSESLWVGECFVFDNRVSINHDLEAGKYEMCYACKNPLTQEDKLSSKYQEGISCPECFDITSEEKKNSFKQRQFQIELAKKRGQRHLSSLH